MSSLWVLLADADLIKVGVVVVMVISYGIKYLAELANKGAQRPPPPAPRPGPPPPLRPGAPPPRQKLEDEVSEFLRRAAERKGDAPARVPGRAAEPIPLPRPVRVAPALRPVEDDESREGPSGPLPSGAQVAAHVREHLDTRAFGQRASHLSQVQDKMPQGIESHVQHSFDHAVGNLSALTNEADAKAAAEVQAANAPSAFPLAAMLADPQGMRSAILLNEILRRPDERW